MDTLFTHRSIGISDLRAAPAQAFEQATDAAVVVLNHNRPAGYILSPALMESILDQLADRAVTNKTSARLKTLNSARRVTIDEL